MAVRRSFSTAAAPTTLTSDINNSAVSITVQDGSTYADGSAGKSVLTIDRGKSTEERILYTSRVGNVFSGLTRGYNGTAAQAHTQGAIVEHTSTQQDFDEANAHLSDPTRNDHTQYALKAATADAWQYVTAHGNDANDGLSQGSAKATIAAAVAALPVDTNGKPQGSIILGMGSFPIAAAINGGRLLSIIGAGSALTTLVSSVANGDAVRLTEAATSPFPVTQAGKLAGFTLTPSGVLANAVGLHIGDLVGLHFDDVVVDGFTGTGNVGIKFENTTQWTEQITAVGLAVTNCTICIQFSVSGAGQASFGYNRFLGLRLTVNAGQTGIVLANNARLYHGVLMAQANVVGTGVLMHLTGTSQIDGQWCFVEAEHTGAASTGVVIDSGAGAWGYGSWSLAGLPVTNNNAAGARGGLSWRWFGSAEARNSDNGNVNDADVGTVASFAGSGNPASIVPIAGDQLTTMVSGLLIALGTAINSPVMTCWDSAGNAIVFAKIAAAGVPTSYTELARIDTTGRLTLTTGILAHHVTFQALAVAGAININAQLGDVQRVQLQANATTVNAPTNPSTGQRLTIELQQDGSGGRTVAGWNAAFKFAGGAAPVVSGTANARTSVTFYYDGTQWNEIARAVGVV